MLTTPAPTKCPDCRAEPGQPHFRGCDVERCSVCGCQFLMNPCRGHDPLFARWTGFWPGELEAKALGVDLNQFHILEYYKVFFIKPKTKAAKAAKGRKASAHA